MARMKTDTRHKQALAILDEIEAEDELSSRAKPIDLMCITPNQNNIAAGEDTDESIRNLAENIRLNGLIHPLVVNEVGKNQYVLLSGERRYRAITKYLIPGSLHGEWNVVNCIVYQNLPPAMVEIVTISANMEAREYRAAKKLEMYARLEKALQEMKDTGRYTGGVGSAIAQQMGVSKSQISKYKLIVNNLSPTDIAKVENIEQTAAALRQKKFRDETFSNAGNDDPEKFRDETFGEKPPEEMVTITPQMLAFDDIRRVCLRAEMQLSDGKIHGTARQIDRLVKRVNQLSSLTDNIFEEIMTLNTEC